MEIKDSTIIVPTLGMDRDTHPIRLKDGSYTFAKNIAIEDTSGNGLPIVQNEPSNYLCYDFGANKVVIGRKYEPTIKVTFMFITDTVTGLSEIGFLGVDNPFVETPVTTDCPECNVITDKGTKLEDIVQVPTCKYTKLLGDCSDNSCLGFSQYHPIKSSNIIYKYEHCGQRLYWTDGFNPPRYVDVEEALRIGVDNWKENRYTHEGVISCGVEIDMKQVCLNCDELKMFPDYGVPCLELQEVIDSGNLYDGSYEIWIAYSDESGNEISNYYSNLRPLKIFTEFSENADTANGRMSNSSIHVNINHLDTNFRFYKLAVRHVSATTRTATNDFDLGVFPITQHSVTISDVNSKPGISINSIMKNRDLVKVVDKMSQANGYLFMGGLTYNRPINLQQVFNLVGPFVKWQTNIANEEFYKDPVNASDSVSFMRDENYPLTISLLNKDGSYSNDFILSGRAPFTKQIYSKFGINRDSDLTRVVLERPDNTKYSNDFNVNSILKNMKNCEDTNRLYRYQYYNTAVNMGSAPSSNIDFTIDFNDPSSLKDLTKNTSEYSCTSIDLDGKNIIQAPIKISVGSDYDIKKLGLLDYLNQNIKSYKDPSYKWYSQELGQLLDLNRYAGLGCFFYIDHQTTNCNNFKLRSEDTKINTLTGEDNREDVLAPDSAYKLEKIEYSESQFTGGERLLDYQFNSRYVVSGFAGAHVRPSQRVATSCARAIIPPLYTDGDFESMSGLIMPNIATRADAYKQNITFTNFKTQVDPVTIDYPLPPMWIEGEPLARISGNKEGKAQEAWAYTRVFQQFTDAVSRNALWFSLGKESPFKSNGRDLQDYPFIQLNFLTDSEYFLNTIAEKPINNNNDLILTAENDLATNRLNKYRLSFFEYEGSDLDFCEKQNTAVKTIFVEKNKNVLLRLQDIGLDLTKSYMMSIDAPIQQVKQFKVVFDRCFEQQFRVGGENAPLKEQFRHMQKIQDPNTGIYHYFACNLNGDGSPKCSLEDVLNNRWGCWEGRVSLAWTDMLDKNQSCPNGICGETSHNMQLQDDQSWMTTALDYSMMVVQRGQEKEYSTFTVDSLIIEKAQKYSKDCYFKDISKDFCNTTPFEHGLFGYHESLETYPDNKYLFDTSLLNINEEDVTQAIQKVKGVTDFSIFDSVSFKDLFRANFGNNTSFIDQDVVNLTCKPMRFFKFPDNAISPFMSIDEKLDFDETFIFPVGLSLDPAIVQIFIELAHQKGLLNSREKENIIGYRLRRGDRTLHKSVLSKGLLNDLVLYNDIDRSYFYPNFPFNSLNDKELILKGRVPLKHNFLGNGNNRFTFISNETLMNKQISPTEIKIDGYQYGGVRTQVDRVEDHPKMVLLTDRAKETALSLARAESLFEFAITSAELMIQALQAGSGGDFLGIQGGISKAAAMGIAVAALVTKGTVQANKTAEYRNQWIDNFRNLGTGVNFGHYITGVGTFNNFTPFKDDSRYYFRGLANKKILTASGYNLVEDNSGTTTNINNIDREFSMYLYLGKNLNTDGIIYPAEFKVLDNTNAEPTGSALKKEEYSTAANLYATLKRYNPSQYGRLENINWVQLPGCFLFDRKYDNETIFGGDTYISRTSYKKKYSFFLDTAMKQGDFQPFKYTDYFNVPKAKYYIDYDSIETYSGASQLAFKDSAHSLHLPQESGKYFTNGRFYLYQYGIVDHLVESDINGWNRDTNGDIKYDFYPHFPDYMMWTQENKVPIREPNHFLYNYVFSYPGYWYTGNFLPNNYNPKFYECIQNSPSGLMYSNIDNSEKSTVDPWLTFRPNNFVELPASNGKFVGLESIESRQLFLLFEHRSSLYNRIDQIRERITPNNVESGDGSMFSTRPIDFHTTELGYGGTQHNETVSNEFGRFWVDARRGQVFQLTPNGDGQSEITEGLSNWFKEHLPFKILKGQIEDFTDLDVDRGITGLGINLGWDARFKRVFLTKLDYVVNKNYIGKLAYRDIGDPLNLIETRTFVNKETGEVVKLSDTSIFTPVHFTVAYYPLLKRWISFYDFYPNYYVGYDTYFRTGINGDKTSIWSHLIGNKSYGVFYGKPYRWKIEVPNKEQFVHKGLNSVTYWVDSLRYHNDYDYAIDIRRGLDSVIIYNNVSNTGKLNFVWKEPNNRFQVAQYPKYNMDGSSDILVAYDEGKWSFNNYFDRIKDIHSNTPVWNYDLNAIDKNINPQTISFKSTFLNRMRGDWMLMRFEGGSDTRYKQIFKWVTPKESVKI